MAIHGRRVCTNPVAPCRRIGPGKHDSPHLGVRSFSLSYWRLVGVSYLEALVSFWVCMCASSYSSSKRRSTKELMVSWRSVFELWHVTTMSSITIFVNLRLSLVSN